MAENLPIFDITSEFPPDAEHIAELRLAAAASRKEVDRRWALVGRAALLGMMTSGTAAAGAMWLDFSANYALTVPAAVAEALVWSAVVFILAALAAYILIQGFGNFYVAAGETDTVGDEADLEELGYDRHPEKCVEFVKLCFTSEVVRRYQNRLVAMGRRPVVGEYEAARRFAGAEADRRSREVAAAVAQRACAQLNEAL